MANILKEIEDAGRSTDNVVGHLTVGEIVIPVQLAEIPEIRTAIEEIFEAYEVNLDEFTVGNKANKINPETGYPEFWNPFKAVAKAFKKVVDTVKKTTSSASRAVGDVLTGGASKKPKTTPVDTGGQKTLENTYKANEEAFDKAMAELQKKEADRVAREEQAAKDRAIAAESARISGIAAQNRSDIDNQLTQTLSTPIQQNAVAAQAGYVPSGYSGEKQTKTVPGSVGGPVPTETASTMPAALIAQKINQDSGGTNQQQNKFTTPKIEGLVFGGT